MNAGLPFVFLILFIALGPVRLLPGFAEAAAGLGARERRGLALRGAAIASGAVLATALAGALIRQALGDAWGALSVAAGLVLLAPVLSLGLAAYGRPPPRAPDPAGGAGAPAGLALSPLAVPGIVGPGGVAAILLFMAGYDGDARFRLEVGGLLAAVMALDLLAMLASGPILRLAPLPALRAVGWALVILQAGFAVEAIVTPLSEVLRGQDDGDDSDPVMSKAAGPRRQFLPDRRPDMLHLAQRSGAAAAQPADLPRIPRRAGLARVLLQTSRHHPRSVMSISAIPSAPPAAPATTLSKSASAAQAKTPEQELQDYARMTPAQYMRARILAGMHLTEDQLKGMDAKARAAVEAKIAQKIKDETQKAMDQKKAGMLADLTV